jgi:hypothetical protein
MVPEMYTPERIVCYGLILVWHLQTISKERTPPCEQIKKLHMKHLLISLLIRAQIFGLKVFITKMEKPSTLVY